MDILRYIEEMFKLATDGTLQGVWFWASIYALLICSYSAWFQIRTRFWTTTEGTLAQLGIEEFGSSSNLGEQDYHGQALYTYSVNGQIFEGTRLSPWIFVASHNAKVVLRKQLSKVKILPDNGVVVYFNPNKPHKSYLIIANKLGICITLLFAIAPLITYLSRYHA